ncbi:membrane-associated protein, putative [Bodo saltans]|uniref:Membrane-associated protein, putative n=1 Tax=Bodo saltans TaxID=75058 RepID=A0A0S4JF97_BODSA|nr:membrane-associated protein, putative [Bodo saltans]|eukprot:CUG88100.1 membrane-associated protein, putative [Bodo saltans]
MLAWTRALFLVGFLVVIVLSDAASPQVGDTYRGGYFCNQGYTDVSIYVQSNTTASSWMVLFTFSVPISPFCTGSYTASVSGSGSTLTMVGSSWISNPCGYVFLSTFTLIIQGTNATPVWYTASIGAGCQQLLVGKSTLRKPCSGVKNGTTSLALLCSIETDTSTPTNAKTVSTSWTEAQSRHSASTSFALSSASSSRSCELCSVTHSSSSSQSVLSESSASSMSPANSISTTFPTHSVQKSSSHSQSLASSPSSTASMSLPVLRTTTNSHSRTTQHSPSVALKRSDSATRSRTQRSHEHSLTLATVNKSASIPVMSLTTTTTYPNIKTTLTRSSKSSSLFIFSFPTRCSILQTLVIVSLLSGAALAIGSTSWCIANNAVAFTLFFVQLVVCIAVRPYVAWFFFLHSCSIQCLAVASAACSLSVAILISNGEGDSSAAGSLNTAASVLNLLAMGLSVVRIAIDLRSLVVALLRIGRAKKTSLRNSNDGEVNQESRNALLTAQWDAPDILHCEVSSYGGDACTENSSVLKIDNNDDDEEHKRSGSCTIASPSSGGPVHVLSSGEEQILQAQFWDDLGHCRTSTEIVHDKFNNYFLERDL